MTFTLHGLHKCQTTDVHVCCLLLLMPALSCCVACCVSVGELLLAPRPHELIARAHLPDNFFWGSVAGTNYLTETRNQHIPQ